MRRAFILPVAVLTAAVGVACAVRRSSTPPPRGGNERPVAVIIEGSAGERPDLRRQVALAVERASGRPVVLVEHAASWDAPDVKTLAGRLVKANPSIAPYDWREPRCRAEAPVLTAVTAQVDAVYRISIDYDERTRPATVDDLGSHAGGGDALLRALRITHAGVAREETVRGAVVVWSFDGSPPRRVPILRAVTQVEPTRWTSRLDPTPAVVEAIGTLPPLAAPRWDVIARRLVASGCPFLGLVVHEARLRALGSHGRIKAAALAAMRPAPPRRPPPPAAVEPPGDSPPPDERYSCTALCGMHMVEICNKDKTLWHTHRVTWEATPCGTRRTEPFLVECYQQQWLSGAYQDSCVLPCEHTVEGRDRLLGILQSAGCVRRRLS